MKQCLFYCTLLSIKSTQISEEAPLESKFSTEMNGIKIVSKPIKTMRHEIGKEKIKKCRPTLRNVSNGDGDD